MSNRPSEDIIPSERRKFARTYFSSNQAVTGIISLPDHSIHPNSGNIPNVSTDANTPNRAVSGNITELSIGGLYLSLGKNNASQLAVGNTLILKEIQATVLYNLELNTEIQIKNIHNYDFVEHVGLGCEFTAITDENIKAIVQLVEWGLSSNGNRA